MQSDIVVTKPAAEHILATVYEAKAALRLTDSASDDLIELSLRQSSDEIATYCNRVFAKETVIETFRDVPGDPCLFLSRFPVANIDDVGGGDSTVNWVVEKSSGRLTAIDGGLWSGTIAVTYTGGYDCPFEVPPALRKAALLYTREAYYASIRGDATVRAISHKESRVIYFDPNAALRAVSGGGASAMGATPTQRAAHNLLSHYTRFAI